MGFFDYLSSLFGRNNLNRNARIDGSKSNTKQPVTGMGKMGFHENVEQPKYYLGKIVDNSDNDHFYIVFPEEEPVWIDVEGDYVRTGIDIVQIDKLKVGRDKLDQYRKKADSEGNVRVSRGQLEKLAEAKYKAMQKTDKKKS